MGSEMEGKIREVLEDTAEAITIINHWDDQPNLKRQKIDNCLRAATDEIVKIVAAPQEEETK